VDFVARVPVVALLSDNGQPLSAGADNGQPNPLKILVVAAPHETVLAILNSIALVQPRDSPHVVEQERRERLVRYLREWALHLQKVGALRARGAGNGQN